VQRENNTVCGAEIKEIKEQRDKWTRCVLQRDALRYIELNVRKLESNNISASNSGRGAESSKDGEVIHRQLCAMHHITSGQDLQVHMHVWVNVPRHLGGRQLCPMVLGGSSSSGDSSDGPIFEFVVGKTYFLSFLIQNRDLASPRRMPFSDVIEVLLLPFT
jgi:hypothetical protein